MEIIQFNLSGSGQPEIAETVYESLLGLLIAECRLPWVEDIFVPGHPCHEEYEKARQVCQRLQKRLGCIEEDRDLAALMEHMETYGKQLALEMFRYGREYQKMLYSE